MRLVFIVFGMVHSNRITVVLLHKHFSTWLSTSCNSISIIKNFTYTTIGEANILVYVAKLFIFSNLACYV